MTSRNTHTSALAYVDEIPSLFRDPDGQVASIGSLNSGLMRPLRNFLSRPSKGFRGQLVRLGWMLSQPRDALEGQDTQIRVDRATAMIEALHAGSLIIDDIQDCAEVRRGKPTLHRQFGTAVALNAANWLYFKAASDIEHLGFESSRELECHRLVSRILMNAHCGQAIDLATPIDEVAQPDVPGVVKNALEFKTGALMSLAIGIGAHLGEASPERLTTLQQFGTSSGIGLQMFDDIGNLYSFDPSKRLEDLRMRRPTWVWSFAAQSCSERDYRNFVHAATRVPDESFLHPWLELHDFKARSQLAASQHLDDAMAKLERQLGSNMPSAAFEKLTLLVSNLRKSYE